MCGYMKSYKLNSDGEFIENEVNEASVKAKELINKFGKLAIDVAKEVLGAIEHEDNRMYYEITFWKKVITILDK